LWLTARSYPAPPKGIRLWALACCGIGVAWTLSASRGAIPDVFSIILSNALAMLAFVTFFHAIKKLKEESFDQRPFYAGIGMVVVLLIYFNYYEPNIWARSILVSAFGATVGLFCAVKLLFERKGVDFFSHKLTGVVFLFCSLVGLFRIFYLVFINPSIQSIFEENLMQDFHICSLFIGVVILTFGFMLMINDKINSELTTALAEVKTLSALLPICSYCKSIRDDQDSWHSIEAYVTRHTDSRFSHTFCPDCYQEKVVPEINKFKASRNQ
jgi:hypothetical protein